MLCLEKKDLGVLKKFYKTFHDTTSYTVLQGIGGSAWVDQLVNPKSAITLYGDFCFLAGSPQGDCVEEELKNMLTTIGKTWIIYVPESKEWLTFFENNTAYYTSERYRLKIDGNFKRELLQAYVDGLSEQFRIERIDEKRYYELAKEQWSEDLCCHFATAKEYLEHGIGFIITLEGKPVAGVSSYSYYDKGIEIEIDTMSEFRRKGLATVLGARIILECMDKELYPSWDAANMVSVKTAEKLGYKFVEAYPVFSNVELFQLQLEEESGRKK